MSYEKPRRRKETDRQEHHEMKRALLRLKYNPWKAFLPLVCIWLMGAQPAEPDAPNGGGGAGQAAAVRLKTIHPRTIPQFEISVEQPADVAPYFRVELYAEVAGQVTFLEKDLGDRVTAGEKLVAIRTIAGPTEKTWEIKAPFDGVIASRSIDPGTFVPSAAIVPGAKPLLVLERNDIVTVSMKVPDTFSGLVSGDSIAEIQMDPLPGQVFVAKPARIAPSLNAADRSLTVQVDLYNRTRAEYGELSKKYQENQGADLKSRRLPPFPGGVDEQKAAGLMPGMYGKMRIVFRNLADKPLVPGSAIIRKGGVDYLFRLEGGVARRRPVVIHYDNGEVALVSWLEQKGNTKITVPLKAEDEIVWTTLSDLQDGQPVTPLKSGW